MAPRVRGRGASTSASSASAAAGTRRRVAPLRAVPGLLGLPAIVVPIAGFARLCRKRAIGIPWPVGVELVRAAVGNASAPQAPEPPGEGERRRAAPPPGRPPPRPPHFFCFLWWSQMLTLKESLLF